MRVKNEALPLIQRGVMEALIRHRTLMGVWPTFVWSVARGPQGQKAKVDFMLVKDGNASYYESVFKVELDDGTERFLRVYVQ